MGIAKYLRSIREFFKDSVSIVSQFQEMSKDMLLNKHYFLGSFLGSIRFFCILITIYFISLGVQSAYFIYYDKIIYYRRAKGGCFTFILGIGVVLICLWGAFLVYVLFLHIYSNPRIAINFLLIGFAYFALESPIELDDEEKGKYWDLIFLLNIVFVVLCVIFIWVFFSYLYTRVRKEVADKLINDGIEQLINEMLQNKKDTTKEKKV